MILRAKDSDQIPVLPLICTRLFDENIWFGGQVEGRLGRTQHERNGTNRDQRALKSKRILGDAFLREQRVA
jgi:hypothetical protein